MSLEPDKSREGRPDEADAPGESEELVVQDLGSEIVVYDPLNRVVYSLNETAAVVYRGLREGLTTEDLVKALMEKYDVAEEEARKGVATTVERIRSGGLRALVGQVVGA